MTANVNEHERCFVYAWCKKLSFVHQAIAKCFWNVYAKKITNSFFLTKIEIMEHLSKVCFIDLFQDFISTGCLLLFLLTSNQHVSQVLLIVCPKQFCFYENSSTRENQN